MVLRRKAHKAVVLAAGDGDRFGALTTNCPKVLLPVRDKRPLITYPIQALVSAGIREIAIVIGYLGEKVTQGLGDGKRFGARLQYIFNPDYFGGNAVSVYRARDWVRGEPFVLCMGDHLIEEKLVKHLVESQTFNETLCVDYTPARHHQLDEATKVAVDAAGCIRNIGKDLASWDAVDTGVFLLTETFFQALHELLRLRGTSIEMKDAIRFLISQGHSFHTCDVSGCFWMDLDTEEDLKMARV